MNYIHPTAVRNWPMAKGQFTWGLTPLGSPLYEKVGNQHNTLRLREEAKERSGLLVEEPSWLLEAQSDQKKNHTIHFAVGQMPHILQNNLPNCLNSLLSQVWTLFLKPLQRHCGQIKYSTGRWKLLLTWHIIFSVIPHFTAAGNDFFNKRAWVSSEQTSQSSCSGFCWQRYDVERAE